jgi:hypothetical protein
MIHETEPIPASSWLHRNAGAVCGSVLIGGLVAAVYFSVLAKLVNDWWQIPDYSHGFLVPVFAAYLVWAKRKVLLEAQIAPNPGGVLVVGVGLAVLVLGVYGAELFLSRVSLVILLAGMALCSAARNSDSLPSLQRDHASVAVSGFELCQRVASFVWRSGLARRKRHRTRVNEAGGGGGMQRHSLPDEPVYVLGHLWILF